MATVVLTVVGSVVGGPVGSAIGAVIGQQIDRAVLGGGSRREGPRLKELEVQTSSYGTQVPAIFGAMRVAGTVIWATDLIERKDSSGGSKSGTSAVNYSYSASLAVALSSRPIERIGRIWADGNLLRGAAGDLKVETEFRFHDGHGDQPLDPLLASAEAAGACPAHRGIAYAVFEDLQLADFGNRIPSLTFEIFERDTPVPVAEIVASASGGLITGSPDERVTGFALQGSDARTAITPLTNLMPVFVRPEAEGLSIGSWFDAAGSMATPDPVSSVDGKDVSRPARGRSAFGKAPDSVSVRHYDPDRDYQAGMQGFGSNQSAQADIQFDLPVAMGPHDARRLAGLAWLKGTAARNAAASVFPVTQNRPQLAAAAADGRIVEIEHRLGCTAVSTEQWPLVDPSNLAAGDSGRNLPSPDLQIGSTLLQLIDLPALSEPLPSAPQIGVIAAGTASGWRRAGLSMRLGDGLIDLGRTASPGVIGQSLAPLPGHAPHLVDMTNQLVLRVAHDGMVMPAGTGSPLSVDAPLIHLGAELLRYGTCEQVDARDYRLTNLLRGCLGSEVQIALHQIGSVASLVEPNSVFRIESPTLVAGSDLVVEAIGLRDVQPVAVSMSAIGRALRPLSPVHGQAMLDAGGDLVIGWIRRTRYDTGWHDFGDVPLAEDRMLFAVAISANAVSLDEFLASEEQLVVPTTRVAGWGIPTSTSLQLAIRQIGQYAASDPHLINVIV